MLLAFILCVIKAIVLFMVVTFQPIIWISALLILIKTIGPADFLGAAADGDYELGKPGPQPG
ncbi:Uncharacterised protein [Raoultella terrigena]|uniref:Uncharacterized protein n=1 Tax=Raoultella terrigena TaxID=577 RepID=A0A3P8JN49_RAOTE|nr:Uncharacterised protein [Raoultella terrigena]